MPKQTPEQRIAALEKKLQALAEDYAKQAYDHDGEVVYQDEDGWMLIVPATKVAEAS